MAQLSDDCFAFAGRLLPLAEAQARIAECFSCRAAPERVPLAAALGRVLAGEITAGLCIPPQANSAVDGYALHHDDLAPDRPTVLKLAGRAAAGHPLAEPVPRGTAARVFTGAVMPPGADTVMMQEDCVATETEVTVPPGLRRGANRRLAGEDIAAGERALPHGRRLTAADLALLAALGHQEIAVRRRLRVALFSTGDEVQEPGETLHPGRIYDANRAMLAALLARLDVDVTDGKILADDAAVVRAALAKAAPAHDLVLTSGGVSSGEEDHVRAAIEAVGTLAFWRVGIKPGRPVALGSVGDTPLLGLPGNPVAALVTFVTIARPVLDALAGARPVALPRFPVPSAFAWRKKRDRREFLRVLLDDADGTLRAKNFPKEGAGIITSLTGSDALAELPEGVTSIAPGDPLACIPLRLLYG
ncbi:MAG: molybdopterin molybdotransferase MoeA [Acidisphaera sp.]|nr:molybdopterin molybdotransferase MoeA [Acidisphaera sp.]